MKKMILVAAPPACGKNYVSDLICKAIGQIAYFDKDDLGVLLRRSFTLCGESIDMDGKFYLQNLCFPIVTVIGLDHIHLFVAVEGLK